MKYFETSWKKENYSELIRTSAGDERAAGADLWVIPGLPEASERAAAAVPLQGVVMLGLTALLDWGAGILNSVVVWSGWFPFSLTIRGIFKNHKQNLGRGGPIWHLWIAMGSLYRFRFRGIVGWGFATQESLSGPFIEGHRIRVSWNGVFCVRPVNRNIKLWIYNWTLLSLLIL